jgi:anaerobic magnesium-protoporphyrin IX monomethyl ester cyclase
MLETSKANAHAFFSGTDGTDVVLLKMPNHNMDYPHLATPTLTSALRQKFYRVEQKDINLLLRDHLLTAPLLRELTHSYLPAIAKTAIGVPADFERIRNAVTYLRYIEDSLGFEAIETIKKRMQERDYDALFADETDASIVSLIFVLTGLLHTIIDIGLIYAEAKLDVRNPIIDFLTQMADAIATLKPRVIGFSVIQIQRRATLMFARWLKERCDALIVVGGPDVSTFKEEYLISTPSIDAAFLKEAESTFVAFLEGQDPAGLDGVIYRDSKGHIQVNEAKYDQAQSVFRPDYDGYDLDKFLLPTLPISTSRGCAFAKCTFCNHYKTYSDFYSNDAVKTVDNLEYLQKRYGARDVAPAP